VTPGRRTIGVILGPCPCQGCGALVSYRRDAGWCEPGKPMGGTATAWPSAARWVLHKCPAVG
jgi:hypothetical protein